jgi:hypothetical protein
LFDIIARQTFVSIPVQDQPENKPRPSGRHDRAAIRGGDGITARILAYDRMSAGITVIEKKGGDPVSDAGLPVSH